MYAGRIERLISRYSPIPMCAVSMQGKVTRASSSIAEVFKYDGIVDGDIFALTGIKLPEIIEAAENGTDLFVERNERNFRIVSGFLGEGETASILLYFIDITDYQHLKDIHVCEKPCVALVNVDNFDELSASA